MKLELSQTTFKRLVWLQIICLVALFPVAAFEVLDPRYSNFETLFLNAVDQAFGVTPSLPDAAWIGAGLVILWFAVSLVALLWFKRWARSGYLITLAGLTVFAMFEGYPVAYSGWMLIVLELVSGLAAGATLLLAYGKGAGDDWFSPRQQVDPS